MAELRAGTVVHWQRLSPILAIFRLAPERNSPFQDYQSGQYIALRRERCRLTKRVHGPDGRPHFVPALDAAGNPELGPVTHSYSIASAPFESQRDHHLEFYIVLERDGDGTPGRLSSSLLEINPPADDKVTYVNRITGSFTLPRRASGFKSVVLVGTGTGLAPFVSMIKQLHFEASQGAVDGVQYTLLHTNRTYQELAYHQELLAIEASHQFDFVYLPSVSRPTDRDFGDRRLGRGRANNVLRYILDMPLKEQDDLTAVLESGGDVPRARAALGAAVGPALPDHVSKGELQKRIDPARTVILTCGNPSLMTDIKHIADTRQIRFEKEDW